MAKTFFLLFGAVLCVMTMPVMAVLIPQTRDFNCTPPSSTFTFNKFDTNDGLYTLNSIKVDLFLRINDGHIIIDNDSNDESAIGTFEFGAKADLRWASTSPAFNELQVYNLLQINLGSNVNDDGNNCSPLPPDGDEYYGSIVSGSNLEDIDDSLFGQYTGSGTYDIRCQVYQWTNYSCTGNIEYFIDMPVNVFGSITITYDYTIPEPATITLLTFGVFAVLKRKHNKQHPLQIS